MAVSSERRARKRFKTSTYTETGKKAHHLAQVGGSLGGRGLLAEVRVHSVLTMPPLHETDLKERRGIHLDP
jgi:hypothetical protein